MARSTKAVSTIALLLVMGASACSDESIPLDITTLDAKAAGAPAPAGLQTVSAGADQLVFSPFTGTDLGTPAQDPINLIFRGKADPRALRAALLRLDGNRTAFGMPDQFPFNCVWSDAFGDMQTGYATTRGWTGSVIQLQCGTYGPIRFHIRLFPAGDWTIANAHFEVLIPGTADHQVLSWEIAEQLVVADFVRSGLLGAAPQKTPSINPAPGYREIPSVIYNGLPAELKFMIGGPQQNVTAGVPIGTDGTATILTLAGAAPLVAETRAEPTTLAYNQVIPRPYCSAGPLDYILVEGPVSLSKTMTQTAGGNFLEELRAYAELQVTPINPVTGVRGATGSVIVDDAHHIVFGDHTLEVNSQTSRRETRGDGTKTSLETKLLLGGRDSYSRDEKCN